MSPTSDTPATLDRHHPTILVVDDQPDSLGILQEYLKRFGFTAIVARDGETALKKAQSDRPELILLDVVMPEMDGFETCRRLKSDESLREIPVIFITSATEPVNKAKGFRVGGVGYVSKPLEYEEVMERIKTHLTLGAIRGELEAQNKRLQREIARRNEIETALRESEELHRVTLGGISDAVFITDDTGTFTFISGNVQFIFGYSIQEVQDLANVANLLGEVLFLPAELEALGEISNIEREITDKAGRVHTLLVTIKRAAIKGGTRLYACRDITERKRAAEAFRKSEERLELALKGADLGLWDYNLQTGEAFVNQRRAEMVGYSLAEVEPHITWWGKQVHPDDLDRIRKAFNAYVKGRTPLYESEHRIRHKSGQYIWILSRGRATECDKQGNPVRLVGTTLDITDRKRIEEALQQTHQELERRVEERTADLMSVNRQLEQEIVQRKRVEEELRQSEQMLTTILSTSPIAISLSKDRTLQWVNDAWVKMFGFETESEYIGKDARILYPNEQEYHRVGVLYETLRKGILAETDAKMMRRDGALFDAHIRMNDFDPHDHAKGTIVVISDISVRKHMEEALRESEERFRQVAETANEWIWEVDAGGVYRYCSPAVERILGYAPDELVGKKYFYELFAREVREELKEAALAAFQREESFRSFTNPNVHKNGRVVILETSGSPVHDEQGKLVGYRGADTDITERMHMEKTLRESQNMLQLVLDSIPVSVFWKDLDSVYLGGNRAWLEAAGMNSSQDVVGKTDYDLPWEKEQAETFRQYDRRVMESGIAARDIVEPYSRADGTLGWARTNKVPLRDLQGNIVGILGTYEDITNRKKAEEALVKERNFSTFILDSLPGTFYLFDAQGRIMRWNTFLERASGYSSKEIGSMHVLDFFPEDEKAKLQEAVHQVFTKGETYVEADWVTRGGERIPYYFSARRVYVEDQPHLIGVGIDLTEQRHIERALAESEEKYRSIVDNSIQGIFQSTPAGRFITVNPAHARMFGYGSPEEMISEVTDIAGQLYANPADREEVKGRFGDPAPLANYKIECLRKDGTHFWVAMDARAVRDESGRILYYEGMTEDISARKETEEALRKSESLLKEAQRVAHIGHWELDSLAGTPTWSEEIFHIFGLDPSRGEPSFAAHRDFIHPDDWDLLQDSVTRGSTQGISFDVEFRFIRPDKTIRWMNAKGYPTGNREGEFFRIFGTAQDITERKQTQVALQESEEKYRSVVENMQDVFYRSDMKGTISMASPSGPEMMGYESVDQVIGLNVAKDFYKNPDERDRLLALLQEKGTVRDFEVELVRGDGSTIIVSTNSHIYYDKSGQALGVEGVLTDITARKRAENALRESEEKYRILVENAHEGVFVAQDGVIRFLNPRTATIVGYAEEELISKPFAEFIDPDDREMVLQLHFRRLGGEELPGRYPFRILTKDGKSKWVEIDVASIQWEGRPATLVLMTDVTERKLAEEAVEESEKWYRSIVEEGFDGIFVQKGPKTVYANSVLYEMLGYAEGELEGIDHWEIFHPDYQQAVRARAVARMRGEIFPHQYEVKLQRKDGSHFDGEINARAVTVEGEPGVRVWVRDVSKRKRLEEAQRRLATAIEQAGEAIVMTDALGNVEYVNPAHERITGYTREEVIGSPPPLFKEHELDPELRREFFNSMKKGRVWSGRIAGRRKDDTHCEMNVTIAPVRDASGRIVSRVGVERDVTQEVLLQQQLLQAQKMEAIGTLAGGIAHDFNNLLTVVLGFCELLISEKDQNDPEYADLQKIFHAAKSGGELVQRLLMFSRKAEPMPIPMNLNKQIVQVEKLLRRTIPRMIDIQLELSPDLPEVHADPSQIEQVLMNLAVNARDAMPDVGKLTVRTATVTVDEEYCRLHVGVSPGDYVLLEVSDTGHGMDKDTVERIFEPFFTTKEMGRGTGLGLAMVYGIVKQHNGQITVSSEVGKGTTFRVYLPTIPSAGEPEVAEAGIMPAFGTETVLLVDDEEFVRELGARILTKHGYTVLQAKNGLDALDLFKGERPQISLVILDLIMPEMGGTECLNELLKIDPDVRVLVASGFSGGASVKETIQLGARGFVSKPFRVKELLRDVRKVLDEAQRPAK